MFLFKLLVLYEKHQILTIKKTMLVFLTLQIILLLIDLSWIEILSNISIMHPLILHKDLDKSFLQNHHNILVSQH